MSVMCAVPAIFPEEPVRKHSTASLSHIEGALTQSSWPVGLRANSSSQNLSHSSTDTWYNDVDHQVNAGSAVGDNVTSPVSTTSAKSTGKFFVFGGTRSARKQRQVGNCLLLHAFSYLLIMQDYDSLCKCLSLIFSCFVQICITNLL